MRETIPHGGHAHRRHAHARRPRSRVARGGERVELGRRPSPSACTPAARSSSARSTGDEPVYGLTTGVGVRKRTRVEPGELAEFNRRLILEHRVGQGDRRAGRRRARAAAARRERVRPRHGRRPPRARSSASSRGSTTAPLPTVRMLGSIGDGRSARERRPRARRARRVRARGEGGPRAPRATTPSRPRSPRSRSPTRRGCSTSLDVAALLDLEAFAGEPRAIPISRAAVRARERSTAARCSTAATSGTTAPRATSRIRSASAASRRCTARRATRSRSRARQLAIELNASQENPLVVARRGPDHLGRQLRRAAARAGARLRRASRSRRC